MTKDNMTTTLALAAVAILVSLDFALDIGFENSEYHIMIEGTVFAVSLGGFAFMINRFVKMKKENMELLHNLEKSRDDFLEWKKDADKYLNGLGQAIDKSMTRWKFTEAEKDIGLLLLKGFSFREIARFRQTSQRTTRQQALEIYRKSGLAGRAEFSAFFLEDLLAPRFENR